MPTKTKRMKQMNLLTRLTTLAVFATVFIISCKKESSETLSAQEEQQAAASINESEVEAEIAFNDVFDNVMGVNSEVGMGGVGIFGRVTSATPTRDENVRTDSMPSCVTVTIVPQQPSAFPKTVTVDFGAGCFSHGHLRSGKIKTVYSGPLRNPGSTATTTFDNFKIDSVQVEGTHRITNTTGSTPGANQRQFKIEVIDGKLTRPNGNLSQWSSVRTNTQIEGNGSITPMDDIFSIRGVGNGKVKRGNLIVLWNSEITEPLIKKFTCRWISKGRLKTVRQGLPQNTPWVSVLDYGAGNCDNQASLTINGNTQQITLH